MRKGVTASQNIALLRYARACHVLLAWNLLTHFPGDSTEDMRQTLAILPKLRHLNPPTGVSGLSIDRFSPYFDFAEDFGITNKRPWQSYYDVLPAQADVAAIAYHFMGDYPSGSREDPDTARSLQDAVEAWRGAWAVGKERPILLVTPIGDDAFLLLDTRSEQQPRIRFLTRDEARATLVLGRLTDARAQWAVANGFALAIDAQSVPLAIASYDVLRQFGGTS